MMDFSHQEIMMGAVFACGIFALGNLTKSGLRRIKVASLKSQIQHVKRLVDSLYSLDNNPFLVSNDYRDKMQLKGGEYTYGEVVASSFFELLLLTDPKPGEIFYDLGCGGGKAVFSAALFFPFLRVKGIELLPPLYELCKKIHKIFKREVANDSLFKDNNFHIKFVQGDLLRYDFSKGNIFFLNATCFKDDDWELLQSKLEKLPEGTRFIVVTRQLNSPSFQRIKRGTYTMSWGPATLFVYRKTQ
jgi:SAM-dependent methyltransferase